MKNRELAQKIRTAHNKAWNDALDTGALLKALREERGEVDYREVVKMTGILSLKLADLHIAFYEEPTSANYDRILDQLNIDFSIKIGKGVS